MLRYILLFMLCQLCAGCKDGSNVVLPPEPILQPIITACTESIALETPNKTSAIIKFTTSKSWTISLTDLKSDISWVSLDNTAGDAGSIEVTAIITEPNPSSLNQRHADIRLVSDTALRIIPIIQPPRPSTDIAVTNVSLNKNELKLIMNTHEALIAAVSPTNATNQDIAWSSSDTSVATVSPIGVIDGVKNGIATITATTVDADKAATCNVTVVTTPESGGEINDWN